MIARDRGAHRGGGPIAKMLRGMDSRTSCRRTTPASMPEISPREIRRTCVRGAVALDFARRRRGRALVRVFNPTLREHGYSSPHTVDRDGERRYAVPGRFDRSRADAARPDAAFSRASVFAVARGKPKEPARARGAGRRRARKRVRLESLQHVEVDRIVDAGARLRPGARRSNAICATCGRRARIGPRCAMRPPRRRMI